MTTCNKCKTDKDIEQFISSNKQFKTCLDCREQSRKWRKSNKEVVSLYNKTYNQNKSKKQKKLLYMLKKLIKIMNGLNFLHNYKQLNILVYMQQILIKL